MPSVKLQKNKVKISESLSRVLINPRITEKATVLGGLNVYTFNIARNANKALVARAIQAIYGVAPLRVNVLAVKSKSIIVRGKKGVKGGGKKALVFLKKGDKIEFV
ncbi:MAG: 50S ribosomal protein L23 [Patescibacteria group bacterium]